MITVGPIQNASIVWLALFAWAVAHPLTVAAQSVEPAAPPKVDWLTGDALQKQLRQKTSVRWERDQTVLREAIARLARVQRVAIFLDRNIDPDQHVDLVADDQPLRLLFEQLAVQVGADVGSIGPVVYIGPPYVAQRVATLAELQNERLARRFPARRHRLLQPAPLQWDVLAEPRELLQDRLDAAGLEAPRPSLVPHDVWPGYDLPPMTWAEQMTLLLAGFRLSFSIAPEGNQVQWTHLPEVVSMEREYAVAGSADKLRQELASDFPQAFITAGPGVLKVRSTLEDHRELQRRLTGTSQPPRRHGPASQSQFTLTVENQPVRTVLEAVAKRLGRELEIAADVQLDNRRRTSFRVEDATEQELLTAIVAQAGLSAELDGNTIRVRNE